MPLQEHRLHSILQRADDAGAAAICRLRRGDQRTDFGQLALFPGGLTDRSLFESHRTGQDRLLYGSRGLRILAQSVD